LGPIGGSDVSVSIGGGVGRGKNDWRDSDEPNIWAFFSDIWLLLLIWAIFGLFLIFGLYLGLFSGVYFLFCYVTVFILYIIKSLLVFTVLSTVNIIN
jgi:hypothetical protein